MARSGDITLLLKASGEGAHAALGELWSRVHREVRDMAAQKLSGESDPVNLQATMLVNEVYMKMHLGAPPKFENRRHFFAAVSRAMEQVLIDLARSRGRLKRGGDVRHVELTIAEGELADFGVAAAAGQAVAVFELLDELAAAPGLSRAAEVVRLRFVLGLSVVQAADVLGISARTVKSDWSFARAWLLEQIERRRSEGGAGGGADGTG